MQDIKVVVIGGTSHVGKSTLADALASRLGWRQVSTDALARHPGRPWATARRPVPQYVDAHYRTLSADELTTQQLRHYERLWPRVEALIETHATGTTDRLVLEGSGMLPQYIATLKLPHIAALWLTADPATLQHRIYTASQHEHRSPDEQLLVEKFLARSTRYQHRMLEAINRIGLNTIDTSADPSLEELLQRCCALARTS